MPSIITRGAASAKAFGFGASAGGFAAEKYLIVPYNTSAGSYPTRIALYNVSTGVADYNINVGFSMTQHRITRVKDKLIVSDNVNYCRVFDITTGVNVQNFYANASSTSETGDICKISETVIATVYKSGTSLYCSVWTYNGSTFTNTNNHSTGSIFTGSTTNFDAPAACAFVQLNNNTAQFSSYSGQIGWVGVDYYTGATGTAWGYISLNSTGTSFSGGVWGTSTNNFSRPGAATGTNNYGYLQYFDNNNSTITNSAYFSFGSGYSSWPSSNWAPCGVANTSYGYYFVGTNYDYNGTVSFIESHTAGSAGNTILSASVNISYPSAATQMFSNGTTNGMMMMWSDSSNNHTVRSYNGVSIGSPFYLNSAISIGSGQINYNMGVRRIYNY